MFNNVLWKIINQFILFFFNIYYYLYLFMVDC